MIDKFHFVTDRKVLFCDWTYCHVNKLNGTLAVNNQIILLVKMNNRKVHAIQTS